MAATAMPDLDKALPAAERDWVCEAIAKIAADFNRSADTHLIKLDLPCLDGIDLYLKDESVHPSGSLKHRLARSLFLYGLCNGLIRRGTPIIECSSGSTAISESYFARLLGLPFIAVIPTGTAKEKIAQIGFYGGDCHLVAAERIYEEAEALAGRLRGHYMDQFTHAERATDWRGNNNIAESLFAQMSAERHPVPDWIVVGAGTGGTSATLGRYLRYRPDCFARTRLCVVDPERSVFMRYFETGDASLRAARAGRIEGIGRGRVVPSFLPSVIDRMIGVPDAASLGTIWWLEGVLGRKCGGSTGTNLYGTLQIVAEMLRQGRSGSVVTLICDAGERYLGNYYDAGWLHAEGLDVRPVVAQLDAFARTGRMEPLA